jgi:hypothetical protein
MSKGPIRTSRDTTFAIELYLHEDQMRLVSAFLPDQCLETANLLEALADRLDVLNRSS